MLGGREWLIPVPVAVGSPTPTRSSCARQLVQVLDCDTHNQCVNIPHLPISFFLDIGRNPPPTSTKVKGKNFKCLGVSKTSRELMRKSLNWNASISTAITTGSGPALLFAHTHLLDSGGSQASSIASSTAEDNEESSPLQKRGKKVNVPSEQSFSRIHVDASCCTHSTYR